MDTFRVRVDLVVTSSGSNKFDVRAFAIDLRTALQELDQNADVAGQAVSADFRVWMRVEGADSGLAAVRQASASLRTALHKAGAGTPGWPTDDELSKWFREDEVLSEIVSNAEPTRPVADALA